AVTSIDYSMIYHQPTLISEYGYGPCTNLGTLPCTLLKRRHFHHTAVLSPIFHIGAVAQIDITKRSVTIVARTTQHSIFSINLFGKQNTVSIERQECIFALKKLLEVECVS